MVVKDGLVKVYFQFYVDLFMIVKGYGVDVVVELFEEQGVESYLVEIGGEMCVKGDKGNGFEWFIVIEKLVFEVCVVQKIIFIGDNVIVMLGDYCNYYEQDGVCYLYLIDLCIGKFIQYNMVLVIVIYLLLMMVDGMVIVFNVMGWESVIVLVE